MIYVNKIYACSNWDCTLQKRLLSSVQCIGEGKEDISKTRTPNPNWDQHVSAPWKFKKSVNDLSTWLPQLETRIESYFWQTEIRDVSGKSVSRYNSLLGFGCLKKKVTTKHLELEMMDCTKATGRLAHQKPKYPTPNERKSQEDAIPKKCYAGQPFRGYLSHYKSLGSVCAFVFLNPQPISHPSSGPWFMSCTPRPSSSNQSSL